MQIYAAQPLKALISSTTRKEGADDGVGCFSRLCCDMH